MVNETDDLPNGKTAVVTGGENTAGGEMNVGGNAIK